MTTAMVYKAYPTLQRFHNDRGVRPDHPGTGHAVRMVQGPPGSGKSVAMCMELMAISLRQEPAPDGVRYTRHAIIRSTYGELEETTIPTIETWFPSKYGKIVMSKPAKGEYRIPLPDGTIAQIQLRFISIGNSDAISKLDSSEYTCVWLNEVTGLPKQVIGAATERSGRYPPARLWADGKDHVTEYGVIADFNPPNQTHWIVDYVKPENLDSTTILFKQPPAMLEHTSPEGIVTYTINPEAENLENLNGGKKYEADLANYLKLKEYGKIQTRLLCKYGTVSTGTPIYNLYEDERHTAKEPLDPLLNTDLLIGFDTSGIHPACVFLQYYRGKWNLNGSLIGEEMGFQEFLHDMLIPTLTTRYPNCRALAVCDPANARGSDLGVTPVDQLIEASIPAIPAPTNNFKQRTDAVDKWLMRTDRGSLLVCPTQTYIIDGFNGEYKYKKVMVGGVELATNALKNIYSHYHDALQYAALCVILGIAKTKQVAHKRQRTKRKRRNPV